MASPQRCQGANSLIYIYVELKERRVVLWHLWYLNFINSSVSRDIYLLMKKRCQRFQGANSLKYIYVELKEHTRTHAPPAPTGLYRRSRIRFRTSSADIMIIQSKEHLRRILAAASTRPVRRTVILLKDYLAFNGVNQSIFVRHATNHTNVAKAGLNRTFAFCMGSVCLN